MSTLSSVRMHLSWNFNKSTHANPLETINHWWRSYPRARNHTSRFSCRTSPCRKTMVRHWNRVKLYDGNGFQYGTHIVRQSHKPRDGNVDSTRGLCSITKTWTTRPETFGRYPDWFLTQPALLQYRNLESVCCEALCWESLWLNVFLASYYDNNGSASTTRYRTGREITAVTYKNGAITTDTRESAFDKCYYGVDCIKCCVNRTMWSRLFLSSVTSESPRRCS